MRTKWSASKVATRALAPTGPRLRLAIVAALVMSVAPTAVWAQGDASTFLGGVLALVTDINVTGIAGTLTGDRGILAKTGSTSLHGFGIETTLDLGVLRQFSHRCGRAKPPLPKEVRRYFRTEHGLDSVQVFVPQAPRSCEETQLEAELGIGYSQLGRIRGDSSISGSIDEFPAVTAYFDYNIRLSDHSAFVPYVGARGGFVRLRDFTAKTNSVQLKASGSTFEYGLVAGAAYSANGFSLFAEVAWTTREFDTLLWVNGQVLEDPPGNVRNFSTRTYAVGMQINFKR